MDKKLRLGVVAGAAILIFAGGGYFFLTSDKDKPAYALQTVEKAVENHNKADFYKVVDLESILDESYNSIVEGVTDADKSMTADARVAVKNFTEMLREPLLLSLKAAVDSYIENGEFNKSENASVTTLLERTGFDRIKYRGVDSVEINPRNSREATARVRIYQPEIDREFIFNVILRRNAKDDWQIVGLQNFQDFIDGLNKVRRVQLDKYLEDSAAVNSKHAEIISDAEEKYAEILEEGTLGQDKTRADLKALMLDVIKKDWTERKQELSNLSVPHGAKTLHNLRIKICELQIGYAEDFAQWMDDKKAETAKSAEDKKKLAQTLQAEDNALTRRMSN